MYPLLRKSKDVEDHYKDLSVLEPLQKASWGISSDDKLMQLTGVASYIKQISSENIIQEVEVLW